MWCEAAKEIYLIQKRCRLQHIFIISCPFCWSIHRPVKMEMLRVLFHTHTHHLLKKSGKLRILLYPSDVFFLQGAYAYYYLALSLFLFLTLKYVLVESKQAENVSTSHIVVVMLYLDTFLKCYRACTRYWVVLPIWL